MRYAQFSFKNFKGIEGLTITLDAGVTTLVGLNESGKTTILEAIFCFSYGSEDLEVINPGLASLRDPEQWIPISKRANFNDSIEITAILELDASDKSALRLHMRQEFDVHLSTTPDRIEVTERYVFENSRHKETKRLWGMDLQGTAGRQRTPRRFDARNAEWQGAVQHLKSAMPRIWYFPNFLFELPERFILTGLESLDDEERDRSTFYRSTFEEVLAQLGYGANLSTHVLERLGSQERADKKGLEAVLLDMGRVITSKIFDGWNRIFGRDPAAQEVEINADTESGNAYLELQIKGPDGFYDLSERSLGFRWFFMFLLMTSFSGATRDTRGQRPLFLLDEPASNLHSSAQAELLKSFEELTHRCHLMYTTHSHHLINLRWLDSAYVVKNAALGSLGIDDYMNVRVGAKTSISATRYRQFVDENPTQTSYFQPVLDLLEYRPSNLEPIPEVVLVEGKSDFYLLRYAIDVLGLRLGCPFLVPGTGAGTLDTAIRLYLGWAKKFVILLDGDGQGLAQKARYEELFEPALRGRCLILPAILEEDSAKEAEDLLSKVDKKTIIEAVYPNQKGRPAAKKALARSIRELYAREQRVEFEETTVARLTKLGDSLATILAERG